MVRLLTGLLTWLVFPFEPPAALPSALEVDLSHLGDRLSLLLSEKPAAVGQIGLSKDVLQGQETVIGVDLPFCSDQDF